MPYGPAGLVAGDGSPAALHPARVGALAPDEPYLRGQWARGQHTARQLWRAIVAQGHSGAYETVARSIAALKRAARAGEQTPVTGLTPRQVVILTLRRPAQQTPADREAVAQVQASHPELREAIGLLERFAKLIRQRTRHPLPADLDHRLTEASEAGVAELAALVVKLKQDRRAVLAAFEPPLQSGADRGADHSPQGAQAGHVRPRELRPAAQSLLGRLLMCVSKTLPEPRNWVKLTGAVHLRPAVWNRGALTARRETGGPRSRAPTGGGGADGQER